jgi:hypothetical protein
VKIDATKNFGEPKREGAEAVNHNALNNERLAYEPGELGQLFGRKSKTWGYRLCYRGLVKTVKIAGRMFIPRSEVEKLVNNPVEYDGSQEPHHLARGRRLKREAQAST